MVKRDKWRERRSNSGYAPQWRTTAQIAFDYYLCVSVYCIVIWVQTHPYQFLLKSFRFPGAKTARKRFLLWKNGIFRRKNPPVPTVHAAGHDWNSRGLWPSRALWGFSTVWAFLKRNAFFMRFGLVLLNFESYNTTTHIFNSRKRENILTMRAYGGLI